MSMVRYFRRGGEVRRHEEASAETVAPVRRGFAAAIGRGFSSVPVEQRVCLSSVSGLDHRCFVACLGEASVALASAMLPSGPTA